MAFLLLIAFILIAPPIGNGVDANSPTHANQQPAEKNVHNLVITAEGKLMYEKQPISEAELSVVLKNLQRTDPNSVFMLYADKECTYQKVINVMKIIRKSGFEDVRLGALSDGMKK